MSPADISSPARRTLLAAALCATVPAASRAAEVEAQRFAHYGQRFDVSQIERGDWETFMVDGEPVTVRRRTANEVAAARTRPSNPLIDPARDEDRAPGDGEWLVVSETCPHAGCRVVAGLGVYNGWACFCHGSIFDLSGRVRSGPAKKNLPVVRHQLQDGTLLLMAT